MEKDFLKKSLANLGLLLIQSFLLINTLILVSVNNENKKTCKSLIAGFL